MLRKKNVLICLAAVVLCVAGIALAAAVKVELMPYANPGADPLEPDASGQAVLNYAKGADKTEIQVNCSGLTPGEEYTVWIGTVGGPWTNVGTFTAKKNGTGNLHAREDGDLHAHPAGDLSGLTVGVNKDVWYTVLLGP